MLLSNYTAIHHGFLIPVLCLKIAILFPEQSLLVEKGRLNGEHHAGVAEILSNLVTSIIINLGSWVPELGYTIACWWKGTSETNNSSHIQVKSLKPPPTHKLSWYKRCRVWKMVCYRALEKKSVWWIFNHGLARVVANALFLIAQCCYQLSGLSNAFLSLLSSSKEQEKSPSGSNQRPTQPSILFPTMANQVPPGSSQEEMMAGGDFSCWGSLLGSLLFKILSFGF